MKITARVIKNFSPNEIIKQVNYGTAVGLTNTAKDGQTAVLKALGDTFTLRGQWFKQSMKYGIRIDMARKDKLQAAVKTAADWLEIHEKGGIKTSSAGHDLAIPTGEVRRNKRMIIPTAQRPRALREKKGIFILQTKNGRVLFQRKGKGKNSKIVALYNLEPRARIKKASTFYEPIEKVVKRNLAGNIKAGIAKAFATGGSQRGRIGAYSKR
jgi:hypothetical protein